eukprot:EG_transcript_8442
MHWWAALLLLSLPHVPCHPSAKVTPMVKAGAVGAAAYAALPAHLRLAGADANARQLPPFFLLNSSHLPGPELAAACCPSWDKNVSSQYAAEMFALQHLQDHPCRVQDHRLAALVVIPLLFHISLAASYCDGETHRQRMDKAAAALQRWYAGLDQPPPLHVLICNDWRLIRDRHAVGKRLTHALRTVVVGAMEPHSLRWWTNPIGHPCSLNVPYPAIPGIPELAHGWVEESRPFTLYFAGSMLPSVSPVRGAVQALVGFPRSHVSGVGRNCTAAQCTDKLHMASRLFSQATYCLAPRGDTPTTQRIFNALAAGCVPIIVSDGIRLPLDRLLNWTAFSLAIREAEFLAAPSTAVAGLLAAVSPPRLKELRTNLALARPHLLWRAPRSAVAQNVLAELLSVCRSNGSGGATGGTANPARPIVPKTGALPQAPG